MTGLSLPDEADLSHTTVYLQLSQRRARWLATRQQDVIDVPYVHVVTLCGGHPREH